jgi:hypothetical protein
MNFTKSNKQNLYDIFEKALEPFPYELTRTGCILGDADLEAYDGSTELEYSEEFIFEITQLGNMRLEGGGWIDMRCDGKGEKIYISGFFSIAVDGDFKNQRLLSDEKALHAYYDFETSEWQLSIDTY